MLVNKHVDFAVANWGELAEGPTLHRGLVSEMLGDNPLGLWVSPGSGTVWQDLSGNGHHGLAAESVSYQGQGPISRLAITPGAFNRTPGQHVALPTTLKIPVGSPITIELWNRFNSALGLAFNGTFSLHQGNNKCDISACSSTQLIIWDIANEASGRLTHPYSAYLDKWTHIVCVSSGEANNMQAIYINGQPVATRGSSPHPSVELSGGSIGRGWFTDWRHHAGSIALAAVYAQALSPERIALRYQLGVQGS